MTPITAKDREIPKRVWDIWRKYPEFNALPIEVQEKRIILHLQIINEMLATDQQQDRIAA